MEYVKRESINIKKVCDEPLFVEEWGGWIKIRRWSGRQRADTLDLITKTYDENGIDLGESQGELDKKKISTYNAALPALNKLMASVAIDSICDEEGNLIFDKEKPEDVAFVNEFDGDTLQKIFEEVSRQNGLHKDSTKKEIKN